MTHRTVVMVGALLLAACGDALTPAPEEGWLMPSFSNETSDVTPPDLTALSFAPTTINTSGEAANVTVEFTATDDLSGVSSVCVGLLDPSLQGAREQCASFTPGTSVSGSVTISFPQFSPAGTWTARAYLSDAVGNYSGVLSAADLAARGFPTTLEVVSVSDVTPPDLTALSFTPMSINTSATSADVTVDFTATDDLSGVSSVCVGFLDPSLQGAREQCASLTPGTSVSGSVTIGFPQFTPAGTWTARAYLFDAVGNYSGILSAANLAARGFPTTLIVQNTIPVTIDIKPGADPNSIKSKSKGTIPVAILSTADFDAPAEVDRNSPTFGRTGDEQSLAFCKGADDDVNGDGRLDLVCLFTTQATGFQSGDTEGILKGRTVGGTPIEGRDAVRIVR
jgi:hypothetical protein